MTTKKAPAKQAATTAKATPSAGPSDAVLVVDDSVAIRTVLKDLLAERGTKRVLEAKDVEEALLVFTKERPRLVFLDLVMPKHSGLTFLKNALTMEPRTKVVMMTALGPDSNEITLAIAEGAFDYLPKPLRRDLVGRVLDRVADDRAPKKAPNEGYG
jgi:two-component system, chemotaxis family, chemotaxis protein CheY